MYQKTHWISVAALERNKPTRVGNSMTWRVVLTGGTLKIFHASNGESVTIKVKPDAVIGVKPDGGGGVHVFPRKPPKDPRAALAWEYGFHRAHRVDFPASKEQAVEAYASKGWNAYDAEMFKKRNRFLERYTPEEIIEQWGEYGHKIVYTDKVFLIIVRDWANNTAWQRWSMRKSATVDDVRAALDELLKESQQ